MKYVSKATTWLDANKGKISLGISAVAAAASVFGYEVPAWLVAVLATQGISTGIRLHAGNAA